MTDDQSLGHKQQLGSGAAVVLIAALVALVVGFWPTLLTFHDRWGGTEMGYSHGYPVLAMVLWLAWRELVAGRLSWPAPGKGQLLFWGSGLFGLSLVWALAGLADVRSVQQLALPLLFWAFAATALGWQAARWLVAPVVLLCLAVPVWDVVNGPLRMVATLVSETVLRGMGIPAYIEGTYIHLRDGVIHIADGCSGLNYLLVAVLLAVLYNHLYLISNRRRVLLLAVATMLGLVANWIRVVALILIGHYSKMQSEMVADHEFFGWVVFAIGMLPVFWLANRLELADLKDQDETPAPAARPPVTALPRVPLAVGLLLLLSGPVLYLVTMARTEPVPAALAALPEVSGWQLDNSSWPDATGWKPKFVGADQELIGSFSNQDGSALAYQAHYALQAQNKEVVGFANKPFAKLEPKYPQRISSAMGPMRQVQLETSRQDWLVWLGYRVGPYHMAGDTQAKLAQVRAQLLLGRTDAAALVLAAACAEAVRPGDAPDCGPAAEQLRKLALGLAAVVPDSPR